MRNRVRDVVEANGGTIRTAKLLGVSKSLVGKWCVDGTVYALHDALRLAELYSPPGSIEGTARRLGFLRSVSGKRTK